MVRTYIKKVDAAIAGGDQSAAPVGALQGEGNQVLGRGHPEEGREGSCRGWRREMMAGGR